MNSLLAVISSILLIIIGLWKFFGRKNAEKKAMIDMANKLVEEGIKENDPSKLTAGFDHINRNS